MHTYTLLQICGYLQQGSEFDSQHQWGMPICAPLHQKMSKSMDTCVPIARQLHKHLHNIPCYITAGYLCSCSQPVTCVPVASRLYKHLHNIPSYTVAGYLKKGVEMNENLQVTDG